MEKEKEDEEDAAQFCLGFRQYLKTISTENNYFNNNF